MKEVGDLFSELELSSHAWRVVDNLEIIRSYRPSDYLSGLAFVQYLAVAAELCDHHPDIRFTYSLVEIRWHTHFVKGLHFNDLVMAKYSDQLFAALNERSST
ncbi:4a-hydroxytetrahydrobiopterin dehydratase [uncultured Pseudoteredinibacter sp.]|uniref:4a-hydroxytetrahydrobiopterin dehydratase n=1 Tax=uncultured Pseudoteredinibacter sp. TaxID=1641701 RepID=UPI002631834A|nr:4a-hydroxytetrahydrobiopterin dehydratase [uncultured Pseudoteredinibacter sp.]